MNERAASDDDALKLGFLMESAHAQQRFAEVHLEKLQAHARGLDAVVRDEIRRTLVEEMQALSVECARAVAALREVRSKALRSTLLWSLGLGMLSLLPGLVLTLGAPSTEDLAALRAQRSELARNLVQLQARGAKAEWRTCGSEARLCVRVDRRAPVYGEAADLYVVRGY